MVRAPATQEIEAYPEGDRFGDFPHPRHTHRLHGHAGAEQTLAQAFASGAMHHAWLIRGPEGVGKATLAYRCARHILADATERDPFGASLDIAGDTVASRQVAALSHPSLLVIRRLWNPKDKRMSASIPIEEVRGLRGFLSLAAESNAWRVVIVDSADELAGPAANALLKSLEEPPLRLVFLLVSSEPGRLLPTIRSRCRTLDLHPLGGAELRRAAEDAIGAADADAPAESDWPQLINLAGGSVRRVLGLSQGDGLKTYERLREVLALLPRVDWPTVHALSDELSGAAAEQKFEAFFELLLDLLGQIVKAAATGQAPEHLQFASAMIPAVRVAMFADVWETTVREKADTMALNLDRKSLILETISRLAKAARG